ncbi:hypothetical protein ANO11243_018870 [Dothideomycetidae sp. 11243]|nr:hypothetical protein ANO11243_018870 [fungal sp. No.11243]
MAGSVFDVLDQIKEAQSESKLQDVVRRPRYIRAPFSSANELLRSTDPNHPEPFDDWSGVEPLTSAVDPLCERQLPGSIPSLSSRALLQKTQSAFHQGHIVNRTHEEKPDSRCNAPHNTTAVVRGISLISPRVLPDRIRSIFPYPLFNAIQSKCFDRVFLGNDNFVLSAPTGSGKTVIFELAIARLLLDCPTIDFKVVYMAPLKALCSERKRDWMSKFAPLNLTVEELTGDSEHANLKAVRDAEVIVTTPEKWDSATRKWKDHEKLIQMIRLFLIDEVHILDKDRGATLEAVVSRMKSVESNIRFIALSATIPNCQDIAVWLGRNSLDQSSSASLEEFGEDFRPVRLQKHVLAYDSQPNDFQFDMYLNKRSLIEKSFIEGHLGVICCTSTLAVGVNLPCHTVIIKGTMAFDAATMVELTDLEISQMMGRAGRPQFDTDALAVIMTKKSREQYFRNLVSCSKAVESRLHLNLIEHMNAEIGLGSIRNISGAVKWLSGTFFQVRLRANPAHYRAEDGSIGYDLNQSFENICIKALGLLKEHDLLGPEEDLRQTKYGTAMSRYCVSFQTMKGIVLLDHAPKISQINLLQENFFKLESAALMSSEIPQHLDLRWCSVAAPLMGLSCFKQQASFLGYELQSPCKGFL